MKFFKKLSENWKREELLLDPNFDDNKKIGDLLDIYIGTKTYSDIIELYAISGGMKKGMSDRQDFCLWNSLYTIKVFKERGEKLSVFYFSDLLIESFVYGVCLSDIDFGKVGVYQGSQNVNFISSSLDGFFKKYLDKSEDLLIEWD